MEAIDECLNLKKNGKKKKWGATKKKKKKKSDEKDIRMASTCLLAVPCRDGGGNQRVLEPKQEAQKKK
jgi:hypothetical protein